MFNPLNAYKSKMKVKLTLYLRGPRPYDFLISLTCGFSFGQCRNVFSCGIQYVPINSELRLHYYKNKEICNCT